MSWRSSRAALAAVCLLLAVIHTWPLASSPARQSRNDNGDAMLNEWIMAWVAHQLPRDPLHLFEANIFYPAHDSLAYSEPLIVPALIGAPLAWLGASPVLVHNIVLILGFALTAFAGTLLVEVWTGDTIAGLLAGSTFAFNSHTLMRLAHVQGVHIYGLPLALLFADRVIRGGTVRDALFLAAAIMVMAYTSGYLVVFASVMIAIAFIVRAGDWWGAARRVIPLFALATIVATTAVIPVYLPYRRVAINEHMVRTLDIIIPATVTGYLASSSRIHMATWSAGFFRNPIDSFFPGIVVSVLAMIGIVLGIRRAEWRSRIAMLVAIAALGMVLSLGTATPVYGWLFTIFPPMHGLRAAARFGNLFLLGMSVLSGLGLAWWRSTRASEGESGPWRLRLTAAQRRYVGIALVALANLEALRAPFPYREFTGIPGVYRLLATEPGPVVLAEQPFFPPWALFENAPYVLASTAHWRPLMNGYSGYSPDSYQRYAQSFWSFPDDGAIQSMKDAGVTHVMVHPREFDRDAATMLQRIAARSDMELIASGRDGISLYRLKR